MSGGERERKYWEESATSDSDGHRISFDTQKGENVKRKHGGKKRKRCWSDRKERNTVPAMSGS